MNAAEITPPEQQNKDQIWSELCLSLSLLPEIIATSTYENDDDDTLKTRALLLWDEHDKCEEAIAPVLYSLCKKLNAQGKKGEGFAKWLKAHHKPRSTAYRWIRKFSEKNGIELPFTPKPVNMTATSSQVGQGSQVALKSRAMRRSLGATKSAIQRFAETIDPEIRSAWASELVKWITDAFLVSPSTLDGGGQ